MYEIDPQIWNLNDERVIALKEGRIRQEDFQKLLTHEDPMVIMNGKLMYISKDQQERQYQNMNKNHKDIVVNTGGLNGIIVYDNMDKFIEVYPEIKAVCSEVKDKVTNDKCEGCAKNREVQKILDVLLASPSANRNLSIIEPFIKSMPFALKRLRNEPIKPEDVPDVPRGKKKDIPIFTPDQVSRAVVPTENPFGIPRKDCQDCGRKHISNAKEKLQLSQKEEDKFKRFELIMDASAHLAEASDEIISSNKPLSDKIRLIRIEITD